MKSKDKLERMKNQESILKPKIVKRIEQLRNIGNDRDDHEPLNFSSYENFLNFCSIRSHWIDIKSIYLNSKGHLSVYWRAGDSDYLNVIFHPDHMITWTITQDSYGYSSNKPIKSNFLEDDIFKISYIQIPWLFK